MTTPFPLGVVVRKEARALLPTFLACALVLVQFAIAGRAFGTRFLFAYGAPLLIAFGMGLLTLGAQSVGNEFAHRTLTTFLAQPASRARLLAAKMAVLAGMLAVLVAAALALLEWQMVPGFLHRGQSWLVIAGSCAFFVAPWLTTLTRSTLAGTVFAVALPGLLLVAGDLVGVWRFGVHDAASVDAFRGWFFARTLPVLCAAGAMLGWRSMVGLEAIDARQRDVTIPWNRVASDASTIRRRRPYAALLSKELRLQQLTFVVAALYAATWFALTVARRAYPELAEVPFTQVSLLYIGLVALLAGSLPCAEERQFGTIEPQLLQPTDARVQWAIKAATAIATAACLGPAMTALLTPLLAQLSPAPAYFRDLVTDSRITVAGVALSVVLTSAGLYCSSLAGSGVRALVTAVSATAATVVVLMIPAVEIGRRVAVRVGRLPFEAHMMLLLAALAVTVGMLIWCGRTNYRTLERRTRRAAMQSSCIAAGVLLVLVLLRI